MQCSQFFISIPSDIHNYLRFAETLLVIAAWLYGKTLGHPYFIAFVCRHLAEVESEIQLDISQLSAKELALIHRIREFRHRRVSSQPIRRQIPKREYFARLVEKRLLIRTKRGRYKLYHPLFREFLRQTQ